MEATTLVFSSLITVMFFLIGIIGGWNLREYLLNYRDIPRLHPEFYDQHGNICLLYTSPSPRDLSTSRMPSSA